MEDIAIIEAMLNAIRDRQSDFESYDKLKADWDDFRAILAKAAALGKSGILAWITYTPGPARRRSYGPDVNSISVFRICGFGFPVRDRMPPAGPVTRRRDNPG
jgi:hypothetical protein